MSLPLFLISLLVSTNAAPITTITSSPSGIRNEIPTSSFATGPATPTPMPSPTSSGQTEGYILLEWDNSKPTSSIQEYTPLPTLTTSFIRPAAVTPPPKTKTSWALPPTFSNMDEFGITSYAAGEKNIAVLRGSPVKWNQTGEETSTAVDKDGREKWDMGMNSLQIIYPKGSKNPGNSPQGGSEFYGQPLDLTKSRNVSMEYSVYFPHDFNFVKGGKLPGLYGGHKGCSGGNSAEDCFSTRIMWRSGGKGELYLYAPKDKQTQSLCSTPPQSICDSEYGLSVGRGAWTFPQGDWTTIRQDIWLNTPGVNDGGFNIWINGVLVLHAEDVRYREHAVGCGESISAAAVQENNIDWSSIDSIGESTTSSSLPTSVSASTSHYDFSTKGPNMATVTSLGSVQSTPTPVSGSGSAALSVVNSSSAPRPTFQTPMRRWMAQFRRDEGEDVTNGHVTEDTGRVEDETAVKSAVNAMASPALSAPTHPSSALRASEAGTEEDVAPEDQPNLDSSIDVPNSHTPTDPSLPEVADDTIGATSQDISPSVSAITPSPSSQTSLTAQSTPDSPVLSSETVTPGCEVGFIGLFFSTFFGGHTAGWETPKDQYTYYKDFKIWVSE